MGFFEKLFGQKRKQPEDYYSVTITDLTVTVQHPKLGTETLCWDDLHAILLVNTDDGPQLPDVWLTLIGDNSKCVIPQGARGGEEVYDLVSKKDGFNFENVILSMSCADNREFLLWTGKTEKSANG